jgi:hypothetical protein
MSTEQAVSSLQQRYPLKVRFEGTWGFWMRPLEPDRGGIRRVKLLRQSRRGYCVRATLRVDPVDLGASQLSGSVGTSWLVRLFMALLIGGAIFVAAIAPASGRPTDLLWVAFGVVVAAVLCQSLYRQALGICTDVAECLQAPVNFGRAPIPLSPDRRD